LTCTYRKLVFSLLHSERKEEKEMNWEEGYPLEISEEGDDVEKGFKKLMNEVMKIYGHLNRLRNFFAGPQAPADPVAFQVWIETTSVERPVIKLRNYKNSEWNNLSEVISGFVQKALPFGLVALWCGSADNIPAGWLLCDGRNGTPDLRERFVLGAGGRYRVGQNGGEETHTLTAAEMPSHSHSFDTYACRGADGNANSGWSSGDCIDHRYNPTFSYSGGNQPHNNMPPYYALCYIMKI
jgi:hypothetical protein